MRKTVFVLGAGFSRPAKVPLLRELVGELLGPAAPTSLREAAGALFEIGDAEQAAAVPAGDLFTMLDRALRTRDIIRGISREQIEAARADLVGGILRIFQDRLRRLPDEPYRTFFSGLLDRRIGDGSAAARKADPFCVVTLNWDTLADWWLDSLGAERGAAVDYGCYDEPLPGGSVTCPSLMLKASGAFNVKLLKLHGSLNFLSCRSCRRLFTLRSLADGPPVPPASGLSCPCCRDVGLEPLIVTPSLLEDRQDAHLQMIWHGAFVELQEAERIVFVGYSFPTADFELRYVLLKALAGRRDVAVRVALHPPDELCDDRQRILRSVKEERFRGFFGNRDLDIRYLDAEQLMASPELTWNW